jgi:hypothetical protein
MKIFIVILPELLIIQAKVYPDAPQGAIMDLFTIVAVSILLACLPIVISVFFLGITLPRKLQVVKQDVNKLSGGDATGASMARPSAHPKLYPESDIEGLAKRYFAKSTLAIPSVLLSVLYGAGFLLCDSFLRIHYSEHVRHAVLFPIDLVEACRPLIYAFIGVFIFNLGTMVRRLYLADINEQVFWGAVNRLLLSMGLALVIMKSFSYTSPALYFSIGFLANIVLDWLLENALKLLNLGKPKQDDLSLQMVRGINIWKEYRLQEEGIENVQNLATADVVDLAVRTHYSARTLIDWIDQSIVLLRLTNDQVKALNSQAVAISAIDLSAGAPENNNGDRTFATALAAKLNVDPELLAATLNRLYEDEYVRSLWELWQSGTESPTSSKMRIPLAIAPSKNAEENSGPSAQPDKKPDGAGAADTPGQ